MKKFINDPDSFVDEVIEGILAVHSDALRAASPDNRAIVRADAPIASQVGIVTGGGSGHLPVFLGYVGQGLCTGVAIGNVFSSPSSDQVLAATRESNGGAGVLFVYGNYGGDVLNFDDAAELAEEEGITVRTVLVADDVTSAPADRRDDRRGVAGLAFAYKVAGAAAAQGATLDEVAEAVEHLNANMGSMGVGLSPTILPAAGEPTFTLDEGEMEIGIGIHGERGVRRGPLDPADSIADELFATISNDLGLSSGDSIAVLVNGLGATPLEELYILARRVSLRCSEAGLTLERTYVGEYATSLEMAGASLTVVRLDDRLRHLLAQPASSPFVGAML
ncbi:MAG: dihydroxyacetone kinase subunit DhaK [Actinobacteria bacterium]|nr:dihydroxyacetone kinase subunit DhaK [Actinomycetota bacterium]